MMRTNCEVMADQELKVLLVGRTGVGTSSAGNIILGRDEFPSGSRISSITDTCSEQSTTVANWSVHVIDSPNFFHSKLSKKDLIVELEKGVKSSFPGLHAFLLVFTMDTFTEQEEDIVTLFTHTFGEEALRHTVVLFTHGDELSGSKIKDQIKKNRRLSKLVEECGGRYHVLNNKDPANRLQVTQLLEKIDNMVDANGNSWYTLQMFHYAQSNISRFKIAIMGLYSQKSFLCVISAVGIIMGGIQVKNNRSIDFCTFSYGFLVGFSSSVVGAVTGKALKHGLQHQTTVNILGISLGFAAGVAMGKWTVPGQILFSMFAGIAGIIGVIATTHSLR
ncbi:GTPase IMAP family member 9-like [Hoplias malabaricus]|uniref:GTPase IMAP family member 9-like n=1 Tax=Hoplias malabaricus TaxID=27720 RepID=UPI00346214EA